MPTKLFSKLNHKGQNPIVVLNAPGSFAPEIEAMSAEVSVLADLPEGQKASFVLAFATKQHEVNALATVFSEKTEGDATIWVAFPKGSSRKLKCEFNRDTGWDLFGQFGFEPVRMVAVDDDWTSLRFRRVDFIKTMTRSFAMTEAGKEKVATANRTLDVPDDFAQLLAKNPDAQAVFDKLAYTHRKEYVNWIQEAKKTETRERRLTKAVEMLLAGKKMGNDK